jgi:acetyltransferase-like isoleucine patch superfamily enzyme
LESALRAVPGLYSAWLRAWGARIGVGVYWTPTITVADRSLLQIDDHVVIGERFAASSHIIKPTHDGTDLLLVVRSVRVGAGAFVGAGVVMGPGASVPAGAFVPSGTAILPGTRFSG